MILLFIGPPGSGKDTQAHLLREKYNFDVISTGDLLREEFKKETDLAKQAKSYYDKGEWVPDKLVYAILENYLDKHKPENAILTGAVRRATQIELLNTSLINIGLELDKVLYFKISDEEALDRIVYRVTDSETGTIYHLKFNPPPEHLKVEQRDLDQNIEATKNRLLEVRKHDEQIIDIYQKERKLQFIDATASIEKIHEAIIGILNI